MTRSGQCTTPTHKKILREKVKIVRKKSFFKHCVAFFRFCCVARDPETRALPPRAGVLQVGGYNRGI